MREFAGDDELIKKTKMLL